MRITKKGAMVSFCSLQPKPRFGGQTRQLLGDCRDWPDIHLDTKTAERSCSRGVVNYTEFVGSDFACRPSRLILPVSRLR